jgi:hypothetical protein
LTFTLVGSGGARGTATRFHRLLKVTAHIYSRLRHGCSLILQSYQLRARNRLLADAVECNDNDYRQFPIIATAGLLSSRVSHYGRANCSIELPLPLSTKYRRNPPET